MQESIWCDDNSTRKFRSGENYAIKAALRDRIIEIEKHLTQAHKMNSPESVKTWEMFLTEAKEALFIFENFKITYK